MKPQETLPVPVRLKPRLLMVITEDWYFWSHRRAIAAAAQAAGFEVTIATHVQEHGPLIEAAGFKLVPIRLRRTGRNPIRELLAIAELVRLYRRERPTVVHHVAIKPILYGSVAAAMAAVPAIVNAVAGLGYVFMAEGRKASWLRRLAMFAYRVAFRSKRSRVIFQHGEDQATFVRRRIVAADRTVLIRGSGVDLREFALRPEPTDTPTVMLAGRLLWDKGVGELVEAVRLLKSRGVQLRCVLVGAPDPANPRSIPEDVLRGWEEEGLVQWWGRRTDMPDVLAQANLIVLPSYGEGVPKILLEAGALGRAVVATDIPGCREVVRHGENGLLVPPRDAPALADAIGRLLRDPKTRARMGRRGRKITQADFSSDRVVAETLALYSELLDV